MGTAIGRRIPAAIKHLQRGVPKRSAPFKIIEAFLVILSTVVHASPVRTNRHNDDVRSCDLIKLTLRRTLLISHMSIVIPKDVRGKNGP